MGPLTADTLARDFLELVQSWPERVAAMRAEEARKARELRLHGDGWAFWARGARYQLGWWTPDKRWASDLMFLDRELAAGGFELGVCERGERDSPEKLWGLTGALKAAGVAHLTEKLWGALPGRIQTVVQRRRAAIPLRYRWHPLEVWWHLNPRAAERRLGL